jgi:hypothetical protein
MNRAADNTKLHQSDARRRAPAGPVFLRAFSDHERDRVTGLFTTAAQDAKTANGVVSAVRSECQRISLNEADFLTRAIASKTLGRIDAMPAFAMSFASHVMDEIGGSR